jgi:hypothetical protein
MISTLIGQIVAVHVLKGGYVSKCVVAVVGVTGRIGCDAIVGRW